MEMNKFLGRILGRDEDGKPTKEQTQRQAEDLEKKVLSGVNKAIREYKETFDILAEYDRSN